MAAKRPHLAAAAAGAGGGPSIGIGAATAEGLSGGGSGGLGAGLQGSQVKGRWERRRGNGRQERSNVAGVGVPCQQRRGGTSAPFWSGLA